MFLTQISIDSMSRNHLSTHKNGSQCNTQITLKSQWAVLLPKKEIILTKSQLKKTIFECHMIVFFCRKVKCFSIYIVLVLVSKSSNFIESNAHSAAGT